MTAPLHRLGTVASTQDELHRLAAAGAPAGSAVVAVAQGAGRGSRGRAWASAPGGCWVSVLLRGPGGDGVEELAPRVGLAVAEALETLPGAPRVGVKWPNDLLIGGRKVGGILCEARWQGATLGWVAVGVGVNVTNALPGELGDTATRLADHVPGVTVDAVLARVVGAVRAVPVGAPLDAPARAALAARGAGAPRPPA